MKEESETLKSAATDSSASGSDLNAESKAYQETVEAFGRLYRTVRRLRGPGGCPWDIAQTPLTLRETLIEESYEAVEAITEEDSAHVCEELGDVFLNATIISYMYEQEGSFTVADSLNRLSDKLIRRHPHVFGATEGFAGPESTARTNTPDKVLAQWDAIKRNVEGRKADSILDEVSKGMPALERACKLQKKAAKAGFDWTNIEDVWPKIDEELGELREATASGEKDQIEDELGDLLFAVVNIARRLKVDPGVAMTRANAKFTKRFKFVEKSMKDANLVMDQDHFAEMDSFWDEAKDSEKNGQN